MLDTILAKYAKGHHLNERRITRAPRRHVGINKKPHLLQMMFLHLLEPLQSQQTLFTLT